VAHGARLSPRRSRFEKPLSKLGKCVTHTRLTLQVTVVRAEVNAGETTVAQDFSIRPADGGLQQRLSHFAFPMAEPAPSHLRLCSGRALAAHAAKQPKECYSYTDMWCLPNAEALRRCLADMRSVVCAFEASLTAVASPSTDCSLSRPLVHTMALYALCENGARVGGCLAGQMEGQEREDHYKLSEKGGGSARGEMQGEEREDHYKLSVDGGACAPGKMEGEKREDHRSGRRRFAAGPGY
jgi:hypothetical protein